MARTAKTPQDRIADLEKRKAQLEAQIQQHKARLRTDERKKDTRRKIIAGALALEHADINTEFGGQLRKLINQYVTRPEDRALFDLDPLPDSDASPSSSSASAPQGAASQPFASSAFRSS